MFAVLGCADTTPSEPIVPVEPVPIQPTEPPPRPVHVFTVAGQSNARGSRPLIRYPTLVAQYENETFSAWPAFGVRYRALTHDIVAIVNTSVGGTSQTAADGNEHWDVGGTLLDASITLADSILATDSAYVWKGVLWVQGERDARRIDARESTKVMYQEALTNMIGRYRAHYGATMPFYIFRTGRALSGDSLGWRSVRQAQEEVAEADPYTFIVYRGATTFPERGLMADEVHYNTEALREMGWEGADGVVAAQTP